MGTPELAQRTAELADRRAGGERVPQRREEILVRLRDPANLRDRRLDGRRVARCADGLRALALGALDRRVEPMELDALGLVGDEAVDADDHALAALDGTLPGEGRLLDLLLHPACLDRRDGAAELVDPLDELRRLRFQFVGQRLDEPRAAERIGGRGRARLVHEDLLRAQREGRGALGRQRERLVEAVRVHRLSPAVDRRERLCRDADEVVLGLLRRQRRAARLRVEAERLCLLARGAEAVAHDRRPEATRGPELRHLLQHVVVGVEEEGEARAEGVRREPRGDRRLAVGDPVRDGERELLRRRRTRLADVVPGDRDRVPPGDPLGAVGEEVGREPHRGPRREDVVAARDVLLEHVVLHGAAERLAGDALLGRRELVTEEEERGGRVDRHRGRHPVERQPREQTLHVVDGVDRDARAPDLAVGDGIVGVVAELRREVEGDREAGLPPLQEVVEARVRLLGGAEPGVLAHRPGTAAVHIRVRAARERELAGSLGRPGRVLGPVDGLQLDARLGEVRVGGGRHAVDPTSARLAASARRADVRCRYPTWSVSTWTAASWR